VGSDKETVTAEIVKAFHASIRLQCSVLQRWVDAGIMDKNGHAPGKFRNNEAESSSMRQTR
jgi:hypothetical protein